MASPKLGTKRHCQACNKSYYDLNRVPIVCPDSECGAEFDPEHRLKSRRTKPVAVAVKKPQAADSAESALEIDENLGSENLEGENLGSESLDSPVEGSESLGSDTLGDDSDLISIAPAAGTPPDDDSSGVDGVDGSASGGDSALEAELGLTDTSEDDE